MSVSLPVFLLMRLPGVKVSVPLVRHEGPASANPCGSFRADVRQRQR